MLRIRVDVLDQLVVALEEAAVDEVVGLDAGEREAELVLAGALDVLLS